MEEILSLLQYINDDTEDPYVRRLIEKYGQYETKTFAIIFLAWLRRYGNGIQTSRVLDPDCKFDRPIFDIMNGNDLPSVVALRGIEMDFAPTVSEGDRLKISKLVAELHRPERRLFD